MALNSKTNLKIIDAICEGPIEGLVRHRESVFLNESLVTVQQTREDEDDEERKAVSIAIRKGGKEQKRFNENSSLSDVQTTIIDVNEQVGRNYSETLNDKNFVVDRDYGSGQVMRSITDSEADFVQLVFTVPRLHCTAMEGLARGQLFNAQIKLEIKIAEDGGSFAKKNFRAEGQKDKNIIKGISTSQYQFITEPFELVNAKGLRKAPYRIRVRKLEFATPEDAFEIKLTDLEELPQKTPLASSRADVIIWNSIIVGKYLKTNYPFTALAYLSIDSEEFNTLPARAYDVKGLKVKIPSNACTDPTNGRLIYDNDNIPFDGSLRRNREWTTCPVCCFYDLLTNTRYGAGDFIDEKNLNWVDLIEISKYCNELVDTPDGLEPRFAINTVLGSQADAYSVLQDMASIFRGMLFWKADNVQIAADHGNLGGATADPLAAIHVFSNSNVVNGSFSYSGSSLKTRSTRVRIRYNDPDNFYKPNFIIIEDRNLIDKYGIQEKSVVAFGCTSKHQAQRLGRWIMLSEKIHNDTVTFSVGLEGLNVLPGQVFEVSDEMRLGIRLAGRIVGATRIKVRIDQDVVLPPGPNSKLSVVMKDGTVETQAIDNFSGTEITLSSRFTQAPPDDAVYSITSDAAVIRKYRCLSVGEGEAGVYTVTGVRHVDDIYRVIEEKDASLVLPPPFIYGQKPEKVQDAKIRFNQIDDGRNTTNRAIISWSRGLTRSVEDFKIKWKVGKGGNWTVVFTTNTSIDVNTNLKPGKILYAQITARGPKPDREKSKVTKVEREIPVGETSDDASGTANVLLPPDPTGVSIEAIGTGLASLRWLATASGLNRENFTAVIRHASQADRPWPNTNFLKETEARASSAFVPRLNGEYQIKFEDNQGLRSKNAGKALINLPDEIPRFNYEVVREDSSPGEFNGDKFRVAYNDVYDGLILDGDASFDNIPDLDAFTENIDSQFGTQFTSGTYFFNNVIDLGAKFSVQMQRVLTTRGLYLSNLIDSRTVNIDTWADFDGDLPDDTKVQVYFRKSDLGATDSDIVFEDHTDANSSKIELEGDSVTFAVTVVSSGGNKYRINGSSTDNETLALTEGNTYIFDQSDASNASNSGHPLRISETSDGTHGGGSEYTTGVTTVGTPGTSGAYTQIILAAGAPTLYYYCSAHSGMGGQLSTNAGVYSHLQQNSDLVFDDWIALENNVFVGRSFQFKAELSTNHADQTPIVDELGVTLQFERRSENSTTISSGTDSSGKAVTFVNAFYTDGNTKVTVGITAFNMNDGDYYVMSEPTGTGFTITFKNGSSVIDRSFQYSAIGYGTQQS